MLNLDRTARCLESISVYIGRVLPWLLLPMAILTFGVVILRYGFDFGFIALQESITYLHAFVLMLCMGYTFYKDGHVRVDIFYSRLSDKKRALVDLTGNLLFLMPMCLVIFFGSQSYVAQSWRVLEASYEAGGLPLVFILKTLIPMMALLLLVQAIASFIRNVIIIRK